MKRRLVAMFTAVTLVLSMAGCGGTRPAEEKKDTNTAAVAADDTGGEQPGEAVTAAMFQAMRDALAEQKQKPLSIDDVTAMIAGQIGQLTPMDKETVEMFQQFAKKMIEQAGTK